MATSGEYRTASSWFKALAHPERLRLLDALRSGDACVCHLEALLGRPQAYVSQQLAALRAVGLIRDRKEGQRVYYTIADARVRPLLEQFLGPTRAPIQLSHCRCPECQAGALAAASSPGSHPLLFMA